jgi:RHS repeat-associated protein
VLTGANGLKAYKTYDGMGKVLTETGPDGNTTRHTYGFSVDRPFTNCYVFNTISKAGSPSATSYADRYGRTIYSTTEAFNNQTIVVETRYDVRGRKTQQSIPRFSTDGYIQWETYSYRTDDRLDYTTNIGRRTSYTYENQSNYNQVIVTAPDGNTATSRTNVLGETIESLDANNISTTYTYYANGQTKEINNLNQKTTFTYNLDGSKATMTDPNAGVSSYTYTPWGQLSTETDAKGNVNTYTCLPKTSLVKTRTTAKDGNSRTVTYTYATSGAALDEVTEIFIDANNKETFAYDNLGRLTSTTEYIGVDGKNRSFTHSQQYDSYGRVSQQTYPSGFVQQNIYDSKGIQTDIRDVNNNKTIWTLNSVDALGQFTSATLGNGRTVSQTYDFYYHQLESKRVFNNSGNIFTYNISFDERNGNVKYRNTAYGTIFDEIYEFFNYDNRNRLTDVAYGMEEDILSANFLSASLNYTYDNRGNFRTKSSYYSANFGFNYDATKVDKLTSVTIPLVYPSTYKQTLNTTYNPLDRVSEISQGIYKANFTYGADDNRRTMQEKTNGALTQTTFYAGNYEQTETEDGKTIGRLYINSPDGLLAVEITGNTNKNGFYYAHTDHLGSVLALSNSTGTIVERYAYDPWGRRKDPETGAYLTAAEQNGLLLTRGFTFHEHLPNFELINMNARLYDPALGRFISADALAVATPSHSAYSYCMGNPLKFTDPSGEIIPILAAVIIGALISGAMNVVQQGIASNWTFNNFNVASFIVSVAVGGATGAVGFGVGAGVGAAMKVTEGVAYGAIVGAISGGIGGFVSGGLQVREDWKLSWSAEGAVKGAIFGAAGGAVLGAVAGGYSAWKHGKNIWSGKSYTNAIDNPFQGLLAQNGKNFTDVPIDGGVLETIKVTSTRVLGAAKYAASFSAGFAGGIGDFVGTYREMREADWKMSDKYFHSKANYKAALRGDGGEFAAEKMSNMREIWDQNVKGYPRWDSVADQKANLYGRMQGRYYRNLVKPSYKDAIPKYRPHNLPSQY